MVTILGGQGFFGILPSFGDLHEHINMATSSLFPLKVWQFFLYMFFFPKTPFFGFASPFLVNTYRKFAKKKH
jgi:hypothetical protein